MHRLARLLVQLAALGSLAAPALAEQSVTRRHVMAGATAPGWSPEQATGAPDCPGAGDNQKAWATNAADAGEEWLELDFKDAVPVDAVRVHQNDNPGAIVRIEARGAGDPVVLWQGKSEAAAAPAIFVARAATKTSARTIRVVLDTRLVSGWNEIDAVELIGRDGSRQWASAARASSTYAQAGAQGGLWQFVGKPVEVHVGGRSFNGVLKAFDGTWLSVEASGRTTLINANRIDWLRAAQ